MYEKNPQNNVIWAVNIIIVHLLYSRQSSVNYHAFYMESALIFSVRFGIFHKFQKFLVDNLNMRKTPQSRPVLLCNSRSTWS